jgi:hypothetical protein
MVMSSSGKVSGRGFPFPNISRRSVVLAAVASPFIVGRARSAESLKAYSIWPENYARPMLEAFEKASGIHVNFIRFSSGEALARLLAEKGNPQVDLLFGGPVETFTAGRSRASSSPIRRRVRPNCRGVSRARRACGPRSRTIRWCS